MDYSLEHIIMLASALTTLGLLIFAVNWRYFRDWVAVFFFKSTLNLLIASVVVEMGLIDYPVRILKNHYDTGLLFEVWVFPTLCILYNQVTRERGLWPIIYYSLLFSAGITALEYTLELYTGLIKYIKWSWFTTFYSVAGTFLISRAFLALYRRGCNYFSLL